TRSRPHLYYLSFFLTQSRRPPDLPSSPTRRSSDLALRARRAQPLVDAGHDLEPVGVVVRDEARRGVEDALVRAMVLGEDDRLGLGIGLAEGEEVGGGGSAPAVDRLVVVAHDREVGLRIAGQQPQHLELSVVRVLELVDEDVAIAGPERVELRRPLAEEAERPVDLVAEVDDAGLGEQGLVGLVEGRDLEVPERGVTRAVTRGLAER